MKITIYADNEIHRQIAMMCVGWYFFNGCKLIGVTKEGFVAETPYLEYMDEITLDLSQVELDLRMAIGTDIEFEIPFYKFSRKIVSMKVDNDDELLVNYNSIFGNRTKEIQLSTDWLKSVGVEVEE